MDTPEPRIDQMALASALAALVGVIMWLSVGGWAGLLAGTLSLVLGFLALSRIKRNEDKGRLAAYVRSEQESPLDSVKLLNLWGAPGGLPVCSPMRLSSGVVVDVQ